MKIKKAKNIGFCSGVKRAYRMAIDVLSSQRKVYFLGDLIHNRRVITQIKEMGGIVVDSVDEIPEGATVVLRAHGTPKEIIASLKERGIRYVDTICPIVKKNYRVARAFIEKGWTVFLVGKPGHPEVVSLLSHIPEVILLPVPFEEHPDSLSTLSFEKGVLIFQTTVSLKEADNYLEILSQKGKIKVVNTICPEVTSRLEESLFLASTCDCVVVVGDRKSSNTNTLLDYVKKLNPCSYLVSSSEEIPEEVFAASSVAVLSGTSTPDFQIKGVVEALKNVGRKFS